MGIQTEVTLTKVVTDGETLLLTTHKKIDFLNKSVARQGANSFYKDKTCFMWHLLQSK